MKAVILAAGQGTRIRAVHGEHPKCLIEVDDATILDHQLEALSKAGINDVAIVVGYEKEQIINHVTSRTLREFNKLPSENVIEAQFASDFLGDVEALRPIGIEVNLLKEENIGVRIAQEIYDFWQL